MSPKNGDILILGEFLAQLIPCRLLSIFCVFKDVMDPRMCAEKAVAKRQRVRTWGWPTLGTFRKTVNSNFHDTAIRKCTQRFCVRFLGWLRHAISVPNYEFYEGSTVSIGR